jgi:hypothetical protein
MHIPNKQKSKNKRHTILLFLLFSLLSMVVEIVFIQRKSDLSLPETVEIAVCVYGNGLFIRKREADLGSLAYLEVLALTALVRLEIYPENAVRFDHGVLDGADLNIDNIAVDLDNGNVLLMACFHYTGLQFLHFLSATHHGNARIVDHADQITAMFANIKFLITHNKILQFVFNFLLIVIRFVTVFCLYFYYTRFSEKFRDFVTLFADC